jgi:hypothetical protein
MSEYVEVPGWEPDVEVIYTRDDGTELRSTIKYAPWRLGHGQVVVGVHGITGGVAIERCRLYRADQARRRLVDRPEREE